MPADDASAIRCPECRALMERNRLGWGCPRHLGHTKILWDSTVQAEIERRLPASVPHFGRKKEAARRLRLCRQLVRFCMRRALPVPVAEGEADA